MSVEDINDNTPEFGATGYIVYCNQYDSPGSTLSTLSATDHGKIFHKCSYVQVKIYLYSYVYLLYTSDRYMIPLKI